ncbi:hypothetical protein [Salibacterium qingdaonense]|uniref:Uncharacterized protein n=1 Tax=Salibacterium qingdaonense TaxID=266892 RepID=A0A1I4KPT5_9BACI|nr:hypothetical protein [Salibacterium qingdaonense]SFL80792.1 hypothetical protein SAMN04488054_105153 [Salibacterium qingdaonense]
MNRYIYSYRIVSTGEQSRYGVAAGSQEDADTRIREAIADIEFTETEDVQGIALDRVISEEDNYYECEGCT